MGKIVSPLMVREGREFTGLVNEHMFGMMYGVKPQYFSKLSTALFERNEYMTVYSYIKKHFPTVYLENDDEWRWMLHGHSDKNIPLIKASLTSGGSGISATDQCGLNQTEFYLTFDEPYFSGVSLIVGEKNELYPILLLGEPKVVGGYFEYKVRLNSSDNNKSIPYEELVAGKRFSEEYAPVERTGSRDGSKAHYNSSFEMRNVFSQIRKKATYYGNMKDKTVEFSWMLDGKPVSSWMAYATWELMRQWEKDKAILAMYSTYNGNSDGKHSVFGLNGHVIQTGAGIREQVKYGNYQTFSAFDIEAFTETLLDLSTDKLGQANRKFVVATGEWGMYDFSKSLENYSTLYTPSREMNRIYDAGGNAMGYKGQFLEFKGPNGVEITLIHDALKDDRVRNKTLDPSGRGVLESRTMDILNLYTSDGKPNIQVVNAKNNGDYRGVEVGMRSPYTTDGAMNIISTPLDGWTEHYMYCGGAQVTDPTRCLVMEKTLG